MGHRECVCADISSTAKPDGAKDHVDHVDFTRWTKVPIDHNDAAYLILHYLETDHPILGLFDAELFLRSLNAGSGSFCSELLVNSLLFWTCVCIQNCRTCHLRGS